MKTHLIGIAMVRIDAERDEIRRLIDHDAENLLLATIMKLVVPASEHLERRRQGLNAGQFPALALFAGNQGWEVVDDRLRTVLVEAGPEFDLIRKGLPEMGRVLGVGLLNDQYLRYDLLSEKNCNLCFAMI